MRKTKKTSIHVMLDPEARINKLRKEFLKVAKEAAPILADWDLEYFIFVLRERVERGPPYAKHVEEVMRGLRQRA
jgi:hypothetical protein